MVASSLADQVVISRQFQKSVRIDLDISNYRSLDGYILQESNLEVLSHMSTEIKENRNCAFTWTGPFGTGKSSLALLLSALAGGSKKLRERAREMIDPKRFATVREVFAESQQTWKCLNLVGSNRALRAELSVQANYKLKLNTDPDNISADLLAYTKRGQKVLLILDELGKYLQNSIRDGDIIFLQELAEAANRSEGRLVVLGILHQSFEAYISNFSQELRDEWSKVEGRFENIPILPSILESLYLLGSSFTIAGDIHLNYPSLKTASELCLNFMGGAVSGEEIFRQCLPLHPVSALLICAFSRKAYGQNERSLFNFISSSAPGGFHSFLLTHSAGSSALYRVADLYDYIDFNQLLSGATARDLHLWNEVQEGLLRLCGKASASQIALLKSVAVIEILGKVFGLRGSLKLLTCCVDDKPEAVKAALDGLCKLRVLIYRNFDDSYGVFAGSDFDFEKEYAESLSKTETDFSDIIQYFNDDLKIVAKSHYARTGVLRWFEVKATDVDHLEQSARKISCGSDCAGAFLIVYLGDGNDPTEVRQRIAELNLSYVIVGIEEDSGKIKNLFRSLSAMTNMRANPVLEGDAVARQELDERILRVRQDIAEMMSGTLQRVKLFINGKVLHRQHDDIYSIASEVADSLFSKAPVIFNEMINRSRTSPNVNSARRKLYRNMVFNSAEENLGFVKAPAEMSIYYSVLKDTGIHHLSANGTDWVLDTEHCSREDLQNFFDDTFRFIEVKCESNPKGVSGREIFDFWSAPPYGIKLGVQPLFLLAMILSHKGQLAAYNENILCVDYDEEFIDRFNIAADEFIFKVFGKAQDLQILAHIVEALADIGVKLGDKAEPLEVARALVKFTLRLPALTRNTSNLSRSVQKLRSHVLNASDPIELLFHKLPETFTDLEQSSVSLKEALFQMRDFYVTTMRELRDLLYRSLELREGEGLKELKLRASNIVRLSDSPLVEQLITHLMAAGDNFAEIWPEELKLMERICAMCAQKPQHLWNDADIKGVYAAIPKIAMEFRQTESIASLRGRRSTRSVLSISFGAGEHKDVTQIIELSEKERSEVSQLADQLQNHLKGLKALDERLIIAALAELGARLDPSQE